MTYEAALHPTTYVCVTFSLAGPVSSRRPGTAPPASSYVFFTYSYQFSRPSVPSGTVR